MKLTEFKEKKYNEFIENEKELYAELALLQENIQLIEEVGKTHIILVDW
jgi:glycine/serine hydroxymethyltransferase